MKTHSVRRYLTVCLSLLSLTFIAGLCQDPKDPDPKPVASFTYTPVINLVAPVTIYFNNTSENATSYLWETSDGSRSTEKEVKLTIRTGSTITMTLTATGKGGTDTYSRTITVANTPVTTPQPTAGFTYSPSQNLVAPADVAFTNTSANATSYKWDFGDGTTSTTANPTRQFTKDGTYSVKLTATSAGGFSDVSKNLVVGKAAAASGQVVFWTDKSSGWSSIDVTVDGSAAGSITGYSTTAPACGASKMATVTRSPSTYGYTAQSNTGVKWSGNITVTANQCGTFRLNFPTTQPSTCDWLSATQCVNVTKAVIGTRCGTKNSVDVEWKNTCTSNIKVVCCIQRADGTWSCLPDGTFDTGMKPNQVLSQYVCAGTGKYKIYAMPIADFLKNKCSYPKE